MYNKLNKKGFGIIEILIAGIIIGIIAVNIFMMLYGIS